MEKHPNHKEGIPAESSEKSSSEFDSAGGSDEDTDMNVGCFSIESLSDESSSQLQEEEYHEPVNVKPTKQKKEKCSTKGAMEEANSMQQADSDCAKIRILTTDQCNPKATHQGTAKMQLLSHTKNKTSKRLKRQQKKAAAPKRSGRISQRLQKLQRLVPGGSSMDTAALLDRSIHYVQVLKLQVNSLEYLFRVSDHDPASPSFLQPALQCSYFPDYSKTLDPFQIPALDEETIQQPPYDAMNPLL